MNLLLKIVRSITLWCVPVFLILLSVAFTLPNSQSHTSIIAADDFYGKVATELDSAANGFQNSDETFSFGSLIGLTVVSEVVTPQWLQTVVEQNVSLTTQWLRGDSEDWAVYIPTQETEKALQSDLDETVTNFVDAKGGKIVACNDAQTQQIKENGFQLREDLCLPPQVLAGEVTITDFISGEDENVKQNLLGSLLDGNTVTAFSQQFNVSVISEQTGRLSSIRNTFNSLRNFFVFVRSNWFLFAAILFLLIGFDLLLTRLTNKKFIKEVQRIVFSSGFGLLVLSLTWVISLGGSAYLTSFLRELLFPGLITNELQTILFWKLVQLSFSLISPAFWTGILFVFVSGIIYALELAGYLHPHQSKNKALTQSPLPDLLEDSTLNGQFQSLLAAKMPKHLQTSQATTNEASVNQIQNEAESSIFENFSPELFSSRLQQKKNELASGSVNSTVNEEDDMPYDPDLDEQSDIHITDHLVKINVQDSTDSIEFTDSVVESEPTISIPTDVAQSTPNPKEIIQQDAVSFEESNNTNNSAIAPLIEQTPQPEILKPSQQKRVVVPTAQQKNIQTPAAHSKKTEGMDTIISSPSPRKKMAGL